MKNPDQLKTIVRERYGKIASQPASCGCCGTGTDKIEYSVLSDDYSHLKGYSPDADLKLGCGIPTEYAKIKQGDTVVDLGSGAGNDCFVARALTGESGKVIGIDFTTEMVKKAKMNASKLNFTNVEFIFGDIENIPLPENTADVVVSNCVMNLVPDKQKAFRETYRILKVGGHFSISDIVLEGELPEGLQEAAALYAGCVTGAMQKEEYLKVIGEAGFRNIMIQKIQRTNLPEEILLEYISKDEIDNYTSSGKGIFSVTIYAEK